MRSIRPSIPSLCAAALLCHSTVAGARQEQPPRFRTEVAAVLVDVLVLDELGQPVSGLAVEDFEVYEDGVRQEIQNFDVIDWTSYVAAEAPRGERPVPTPPEAAATNVFPRRFIFVLNRQGAEFGYMVRAKRAMESFIVESMAGDDEAMVIDIGQSTRILQQFTPFKEEILQAIKKLQPMEANIFFGTRIATQNVYDTLEALGEALIRLPGRKVVVFMSPTLSRTQDLLRDLQDTVDALNQSNTTVYSVNIVGTGGVRADESGFDDAVLSQISEGEASSLDSFEIGGLFPLANETGGRYFYNLNTFEPAVQRIGKENQRYYLLTYVPANTELDNKYRRIEVRVDRPNVRVKARKGYFPRKAGETVVADEGGEPQAPSAPPQATAPAKISAASPAAAPTAPRPPMQVEITNYFFPNGKGTIEVPIAVALPLELVSGDGGPRTLQLTLTDAAGASVASFSDEVDATDFSIVRNTVLPPGSYLLRITLNASGKTIYQSSTQLDVPSGFGDRFGLSSIAPIISPEIKESGGLPIRPTSTLRVGEDVFLHFRVYPGTRGEPSESAEVIYSVYQEGREILSLKQPGELDLKKGKAFGFPVLARLPTSRLGPGTYRVVVEVADSKLARRTTGEIELTIAR